MLTRIFDVKEEDLLQGEEEWFVFVFVVFQRRSQRGVSAGESVMN